MVPKKEGNAMKLNLLLLKLCFTSRLPIQIEYTEQVATTKAGFWLREFLLAENLKKVWKLGEKVGKIWKKFEQLRRKIENFEKKLEKLKKV